VLLGRRPVLRPAVRAGDLLGGAAAGDPSAVRELIVVELFPMRAPIPRTLPDVLERMVQLRFTSRLTLDEAFLQPIDRLADLVAKVDRQLPTTATSATTRRTGSCWPGWRSITPAW
jgi:hypothetical protein